MIRVNVSFPTQKLGSIDDIFARSEQIKTIAATQGAVSIGSGMGMGQRDIEFKVPEDKLFQFGAAMNAHLPAGGQVTLACGGAFDAERTIPDFIDSAVRRDAAASADVAFEDVDTASRITDALRVLILTPHIRDYLDVADQAALEQARAALGLPA